MSVILNASGGGGGGGRTPLTANATYYVSTTGSDVTGNGSLAKPWATLQFSLNALSETIDINGYILTLQIEDGTYVGFDFPAFIDSAGGIARNPISGTGMVVVLGNTSDVTKVKLTPIAGSQEVVGVFVPSGALNNVDSLTCDFTASTSVIAFICGTSGGTALVVGNALAGPSSGIAVNSNSGNGVIAFWATQMGRMDVSGNVSLTGNFGGAFSAEQNSVLTTGVWNVTTVTVENGTVMSAFAAGGDGQSGIIQFQETTFVDNGSTGLKFVADGPTASVDVAGAGGASPNLSVLPGNAAGYCKNGGQYIYLDGSGDVEILIGYLGSNQVTKQNHVASEILDFTPFAGISAFATDLGVTFVADGTTWQIDSSYYTPQPDNYDIGEAQFSNRIGYGKTYVTDKDIVNCTIGYGSIVGVEGAFRHNPTTFMTQIYTNGSWQTVVAGFNFSEENGYIFADAPLANRIEVYSGNSDLLGLNGIPIIHNYTIDMGAYPFPSVINGGTF